MSDERHEKRWTLHGDEQGSTPGPSRPDFHVRGPAIPLGDSVEVVPLERVEELQREINNLTEETVDLRADRDALLPFVRHVAGLVAPEAGFEYGEVHRQLIYDARAALAALLGSVDGGQRREPEHTHTPDNQESPDAR